MAYIKFLKHEKPIIAGNYFGTKFWVVTHASAKYDVTLALLGQSYEKVDIAANPGFNAIYCVTWD